MEYLPGTDLLVDFIADGKEIL